jgi:hypothetical protein
MKKLIAIAVVFALAAGGVFADVGGAVIGTVNLFQGNTAEGSEVTGGAAMNRVRIEGTGENDDGTFGAFLRLEGGQYGGAIIGGGGYNVPGLSALAWWKPIDQIKLTIGGNPDGIFGKEGYAGWMFHQIVADTGVVNASQAWGCDYTLGGPPWNDRPDMEEGEGYAPAPAIFRDAFYAGFDSLGLLLEIKPVDMFGINIVLPYFIDNEKVSDIFKQMTIQADINLDFGNIALTFDLIENTMDPDKIGAKLYAYFGLSAIDNLSLDVGIGFKLPQSYSAFGYKATRMDPIAFGLGMKFSATDSFGIKARLLAEAGGSSKTDLSGDIAIKDPFALIFEVIPFFSVSDSVTIFADIGLNMVGAFKYDGETVAESGVGFHFNPYVQIGNEWGPSFFVGVKVWASPSWVLATEGTIPYVKADKTIINFAVPIALNVSF